ncbi:hypothetical protein IMSAGC007_03225 [Lachnospiraceae bacterium]|nr:hypothetical protein IMSAGC007_03225 [Lachnospiraceae bacterium]
MARTVSIGCQDFETLQREGYFYIDKTLFIKEWWEGGDSVTLITRPRRFGKTLNMSMTEQFFSVEYAGRGDLFEKLAVWKEEKYRKLQGTYPVISLSLASIKDTSYETARRKICHILTSLYSKHRFLLEEEVLDEKEKDFFASVSIDMDDVTATLALHELSGYLSRYYGKKVIILLDEYDTPMQEAYVNGYWAELVSFTRSMFNAAFKTNPYLERAIMTGITRVSRESVFSDLNNMKVVTTTSDAYADCFGFTEEEVFQALDEFEMADRRQEVKKWYDGFTFGSKTDMYNPWSILNYLDAGKLGIYWANSSSNSLAGKLIREASPDIKQEFEELLLGQSIVTPIDEQTVYGELDGNEEGIWSLLLASGYLKVLHYEEDWDSIDAPNYELTLTNREVKRMFCTMVRGWFQKSRREYNGFIKALLEDDLKTMNYYMNKVALATFSTFDTGNKPSEAAEPERFYHGFILGLLVELSDRYTVTSNRESGFGRCDVILEPKQKDDGILLEFKVQDTDDEKELSDTVKAALQQIEKKKYETLLTEKGIPKKRIRKYGFAFSGKQVLIGKE